jgi:phosphoglucomutase
MSTLQQIQSAAQSGQLLPAAAENLAAWLNAGLPAWATASVDELVAQGAWGELNDRFYRYLEFGTGGMRGRTIGTVVTAAERGPGGPQGALTGLDAHTAGPPAHAAAGSNVLNDFTLLRAVIGLFNHTQQQLAAAGRGAAPRLVIAHDVRHFSRHFCELAASAWTRLGGAAFIFDGPRSTPQLSFTVRWLKAHCGVVITASHNPPHDNGFKAYGDDGAQVVPPHDAALVAAVNAVPLGGTAAFLDKNLAGVVTLGRPADDAYLAAAATAALAPEVFRGTKLKVAFTSIHGTGSVATLPLLLHAGCAVHEVREQIAFDGGFPTVKSPNPENAEALSRAVTLAERDGCDLVLATDPDCDRMGVAVRNRAGKMELLTGNQTGALLIDYRLEKMKALGHIPAAGSERVAVIKTFVTSPLQDAIARAHGVKVVNMLTGFKWIAAKIRRYEEKLRAALGPGANPDALTPADRAALLQKHSTFFAFGAEESYGYLPNDLVRDKDGNAACLAFAELCAAVKARGQTVPEQLDALYARHGYFLEGVINLYYEGASGAAKIKRILDTYRAAPPKEFGGVAVAQFQDFGRQDILDADGEKIPKQDFYVVTLANGWSFAARGSGTEPKMKFYLFARAPVPTAAALPVVKTQTKTELERLKSLIEADAKRRAEG